MSNLRRSMMMAGRGGGDPWIDWVKFTFTLTSAVSQKLVVDDNNNRVPLAAFEQLRMAVDGEEITPVRKIDLAAGAHTIAYYIQDGDWLGNVGWWYWVGHSNAIWDFPAIAHNLGVSSLVMAALQNQTMIFRSTTPPMVAAVTWNYVKNRVIYVPSGSQSAYAAVGFTNIHTIDEL